MDIIQAIILGIVQGLGEFIPISSSAHLILTRWLFGWPEPGLSFDVALHLGTFFAVIIYFWKDWVRLVKAWVSGLFALNWRSTDAKLAWLLIIGSIPGAVVGFFAEAPVEALFHPESATGSAQRVGAMVALGLILALLGILLFFADRIGQRTKETGHISLKDTLVIGLAQAAAVFPGVSRSGATITMGLFMGLTRETAARFSFLLGTPIVAGAAAKAAYGIIKTGLPADERSVFLAGMVTAGLVGYLCIAFLLRYLQRNSTTLFVSYRLCIGAVVVLIALIRG